MNRKSAPATPAKPKKAPPKNGGAAKAPKARTDEAYVYILGSRQNGDDCRTYVGWTNDIDKRLAAHNSGGGAKSTRGRSWFLIYVERCKTRREAMSREWHIKHDRKLRTRMLAALREV